MPLVIFSNLEEKDKAKAIEKLIAGSTPSQDFFLMVVLSILMATFGLILDSITVVIGSMLIAPILYPILGLSLGIIMSDFKLIGRALMTLIKSLVFGVFLAALATLFFATRGETIYTEALQTIQPSLLYVSISIIAGLAASFAFLKPQLNEILPGVAISVAILPPMAAIGIGIGDLNWAVISASLSLLAINIAGVVFASMLIFSLMNLYAKRHIATETAKVEDKKIKDDVEEAKQDQEKNK